MISSFYLLDKQRGLTSFTPFKCWTRYFVNLLYRSEPIRFAPAEREDASVAFLSGAVAKAGTYISLAAPRLDSHAFLKKYSSYRTLYTSSCTLNKTLLFGAWS